MDGKIWQLLYDRAAGEHMVQWWTLDQWENWQESGVRNQYGHFSEWAHGTDEAALEKEIEAMRGPTIWAVYFNRPAWEGFVSAEDGLSGNWRGSKYGHFDLVAEYSEAEHLDAEDRAGQHLEDLCNHTR